MTTPAFKKVLHLCWWRAFALAQIVLQYQWYLFVTPKEFVEHFRSRTCKHEAGFTKKNNSRNRCGLFYSHDVRRLANLNIDLLATARRHRHGGLHSLEVHWPPVGVAHPETVLVVVDVHRRRVIILEWMLMSIEVNSITRILLSLRVRRFKWERKKLPIFNTSSKRH